MNDNDIDVPNMNDIEPGDGNNGSIIAYIFAGIVLFLSGLFIGNKGKKKAVNAAYKKGYKDASDIFEKKFKNQHDAFIKKELDWKNHEEEYRRLLADYESYIDELESEEDSEENDGKICFFKAKLEELEGLDESC